MKFVNERQLALAKALSEVRECQEFRNQYFIAPLSIINSSLHSAATLTTFSSASASSSAALPMPAPPAISSGTSIQALEKQLDKFMAQMAKGKGQEKGDEPHRKKQKTDNNKSKREGKAAAIQAQRCHQQRQHVAGLVFSSGARSPSRVPDGKEACVSWNEGIMPEHEVRFQPSLSWLRRPEAHSRDAIVRRSFSTERDSPQPNKPRRREPCQTS